MAHRVKEARPGQRPGPASGSGPLDPGYFGPCPVIPASPRFTACHSASISSSDASAGVRPCRRQRRLHARRTGGRTSGSPRAGSAPHPAPACAPGSPSRTAYRPARRPAAPGRRRPARRAAPPTSSSSLSSTAPRVRPVEPHPGRAPGQLLRPRQRRQPERNAGQRAGLGPRRALGALLLLPRRHLHPRGPRRRVAEHMRMPPHHLVGDVPRHIGEAEPAFLLGHAGVVDHLEQQIAQLVRQGGKIRAAGWRRPPRTPPRSCRARSRRNPAPRPIGSPRPDRAGPP